MNHLDLPRRSTSLGIRHRFLAAVLALGVSALPAASREITVEDESDDGLTIVVDGSGSQAIRVALPPGRDVAPAPGATVTAHGWAGRVRYADIVVDASPRGPRTLRIGFTDAAPPPAEVPPALWSDEQLRTASGGLAQPVAPAQIVNPLTAERAVVAARTSRAARPPLPGGELPAGAPFPARPVSRRMAMGSAEATVGLAQAATVPLSFGSGRVRLTIQPDAPGAPGGPGIYRITHAMLASLGVDLSDVRLDELRLRTFGLYYSGLIEDLEVALKVHDEDGDGIFGASDWFEFWGEPLVGENIDGIWQKGDFTDTRGYLLDTAPGARERFSLIPDARPVSPPSTDWLATAHAETDDLLVGNPRVGLYGVDHFYWCSTQRLRWDSGGPEAVRTETVDLPGLAPASARLGALRVDLLHRLPDNVTVDPDWRSVLDFNARLGASDLTGNGYSLVNHVLTGLQPATDLRAAGNVVRLHAPGMPGATSNLFDLDQIEIDYPKTLALESGRLVFTHETGRSVVVSGAGGAPVTILDVSDALHPREVQGVTPSAGAVAFEILEADADGMARYAIAEDPSGEPALQPAEMKVYPGAGLRDPSISADVLVIGPRAWLEAQPAIPGLARWVADRQAQGLRVRMVSTEDMMDDIGTGTFTPFAVGRLLSIALATWTDAPRYCLLLGDTTLDYADRTNGLMLDATACTPLADSCGFDETAWCQHVPTRMFDVPSDDLFLGYYASDTVASLAAGSDWYPDVAVGRIPARDATEVGDLLDKVLSYEALASSPPPWASRVMLVADAIDPAVPEEQGFESYQLAARDANVPPQYPSLEMFYQRDYGGSNQPPFTRDLLADWTDPARSAAVLTYVGHGSSYRWSKQDVLLNRGTSPCRDDVAGLAGSDPEPFVVNANCITGTFVYPLSPSLLEAMVREPQGGAIASFGPTGLTALSDAPIVLDALYGNIHGRAGRGLRLGDVVLRMETALAVDPGAILWNAFLGDPTLKLIVPFGPAAISLSAAAGDGLVDLSWPAVAGAASYSLYRSDTGANGPWTLLAGGIASTSFRDQGDPPGPLGAVVDNQLYHYALEPVDARGYPGRWSDPASARPCTMAVPEPASGLTVAPGACTGSFVARWTASPTPSLQSYVLRVYRGMAPTGAPVLTMTPRGTFVSVSGLENWVTYTFTIAPLSWCNVEGPAAAPASARVTCPVTIDPPSFIADLRVTRAGTGIALDWAPVTLTAQGTPLTPVRYDVHRTVDPAFVPDASSLIASPAAPGYVDASRVGDGTALEMWVVGAVDASGRVGSLCHDYPQGVRNILRADAGTDWQLTWAPVVSDIHGEVTPVARYFVYSSDMPIDRARVQNDPTLVPVAVVTSPQALIPKVPGVTSYYVMPEDLHGNRSVY